MKKNPQQIAFEEANRIVQQLKERDRLNFEAWHESENTTGVYQKQAPKDTLYAVQLLISAAALLREPKPPGRPKTIPAPTNKKARAKR